MLVHAGSHGCDLSDGCDLPKYPRIKPTEARRTKAGATPLATRADSTSRLPRPPQTPTSVSYTCPEAHPKTRYIPITDTFYLCT